MSSQSSMKVPCVARVGIASHSLWGPWLCRCSAALVTEVQTVRTAGWSAAELGSLQRRTQERSDIKEVESLEALWAPRSSDDSRAMLEHLQAQVASSGSCSGLNGAFFCHLALMPGSMPVQSTCEWHCQRGVGESGSGLLPVARADKQVWWQV